MLVHPSPARSASAAALSITISPSEPRSSRGTPADRLVRSQEHRRRRLRSCFLRPFRRRRRRPRSFRRRPQASRPYPDQPRLARGRLHRLPSRCHRLRRRDRHRQRSLRSLRPLRLRLRQDLAWASADQRRRHRRRAQRSAPRFVSRRASGASKARGLLLCSADADDRRHVVGPRISIRAEARSR